MKLTNITDKMIYVEPDSMTKFSSCSGLIFKSNVKLFIDTNIGHEDTPALFKQEKPDIVMITHFHLDHSAFIRYVEDHSDTKILIPEKEAPFLSSLDFMIDNTAGLIGMADQWREFVKKRLNFRVVKNYECFNENTSLKDLIPEMELIPTPGHSPAHTSFYFPEDKILFSGDLGLDRFGPWYGWKNCDIREIVESILKLSTMDIKLILTSHGGIIDKDIPQIFSRSLAHIVEREKKISRQLDMGMEREEIIDQGILYPPLDKLPENMSFLLHMWDTAMFDHHLALIEQGGVLKFFRPICDKNL